MRLESDDHCVAQMNMTVALTWLMELKVNKNERIWDVLKVEATEHAGQLIRWWESEKK